MNPQQSIQDEEEPIPECLINEVIQTPQSNDNIQNNNNDKNIGYLGSEKPNKPQSSIPISNNENNIPNIISSKSGTKPYNDVLNNSHSRSNQCNTNPVNQSINNTSRISKANTCAVPSNSYYQNFDVQKLTYDINKDYSQLRISKEENFMERMKFDIYKRQIKEERINKLVEKNTVKLEEEERIKTFNRLIEDANRRIEAQENLEAMKSKLEDDMISPPSKKYKDEEWNEIYKERFKKYQEEVNEKNQQKFKDKQEEERLRLDSELELCKTKTAPMSVIDESSKRWYEESIKRRLKMDEKLSKINYENSPSKYKKIINANAYNFMSDGEDNGEDNNNQNYQTNQNDNNVPRQPPKKRGKIAVSEYNNQRFNIASSQQQRQGQPQQYQRQHPDYTNNNSKNLMNPKHQTKYLDHYLEDEDEVRDIPKPVNKAEPQLKDTTDFNQRKLEIAAANRWQNTQNQNQNPNKINKMNNMYQSEYSRGNMISIKENEASKIVDQFFTKNLKY